MNGLGHPHDGDAADFSVIRMQKSALNVWFSVPMNRSRALPSVLLAVTCTLTAFSCHSDPEPQRSSSSSSSSPTAGESPLEQAATRWKKLTWDERAAVCAQAEQSPRPDFRGMLQTLESLGFTQNESTAMLPYATGECL